MKLPVNEIICGDCLDVMRDWPDESVDCCVTSPPYWGLRDYGVDGQLGLEETPEEYVAKMVEIFQEVKRVLKPAGTLWLNLGDSYNSGTAGSRDPERWPKQSRNDHVPQTKPPAGNLKHKDLCGIPWRVAFALQADGWYLRQDIIWHKPNPMPESVRDRCTKAHEYIFLLTKKPRYYYDSEAIKEPSKDPADDLRRVKQAQENNYKKHTGLDKDISSFEAWSTKDPQLNLSGRNKRSVWTVTTKPYAEAHFATFPPDLITPCILAGCPKEVCKKCGKGRERIVKRSGGTTGESWHDHDDDIGKGIVQTRGGVPLSTAKTRKEKENPYKVETTGWTDCGCGAGFEPGIVFDPFMGSGTVAEVAVKTGRNYVGCELNQEYIDLGRVKAVETGVPVAEQRNLSSR